MVKTFNGFAAAFFGVWIFQTLHLPLPWLLGPITFCLLAALVGLEMRGIQRLNDGMRTILGVAVGTTLTPAVLLNLPSMWPTLLLVPLMTLAIGLVGIPYFLKLWKFDFATAYYSAMPGGLQDMVLFGEQAGAKIRTLSLIHATRVAVIVIVLPFILKGLWDADLTTPPGVPAKTLPVSQMALMIVCALVGWWVAEKINMFGASILGPLIATGILTALGVVEYRPPVEAIWAAQFFIGMTIGSKYSGITLAEARRDLVAGLGFCFLLMVLTLVLVELVYGFDLAPGMEALLAFAPGGQAEMTVLAIIVGADIAFVATHHILRIFVVIIGAPIAARLVRSLDQTKDHELRN